jgi:hypothetical protein
METDISTFHGLSIIDPNILDLICQGGVVAEQVQTMQCIDAYATHWLYKEKWNNKHKIPGWQRKPNDFRIGIVAYGNYLLQVLELCLQASITTNKYQSSGDRFCFLLLEMKHQRINDILNNVSRKTEILTRHKHILAKLRRYTNPYKSNTEYHHWLLFEFAIKAANKSELFNKDSWKPFLNAYKQWIDDMYKNSNWICVFEDSGKLAYHPKESKSTKYLYSPLSELLTP